MTVFSYFEKSFYWQNFFTSVRRQLQTILLHPPWSEDSKYVLKFNLWHKEVGQKIGVTFGRDTQTDKHRSLLYRFFKIDHNWSKYCLAPLRRLGDQKHQGLIFLVAYETYANTFVKTAVLITVYTYSAVRMKPNKTHFMY